MTQDKDAIRRNRDALVRALQDAGGGKLRGCNLRCPFHADKNASLSIHDKPDGFWRAKCHGCDFRGDVFDVLARMQGKDVGEVLKQEMPKSAGKPQVDDKPKKIHANVESIRGAWRNLEDLYAYVNPVTHAVDMVVVRIRHPDGSKDFIQYRPCEGGLTAGGPDRPWPLFNRTRLQAAHTVVVCEGEKAVKRLQSVMPAGFAATTSPAGAGKAAYADWSILGGKKVVLWPDNDPPNPADKPRPGVREGFAHMQDVAKRVGEQAHGASTFWINPDDLGLDDKDDAWDFLERLKELSAAEQWLMVQTVVDAAEPLSGGAARLLNWFKESIAGKNRSTPIPHKVIGGLSKWGLPGTVTILGAPGGSSKSFLVLEWSEHWLANNIKFAMYALEEDELFTLRRVIGQIDNNGNLGDPDWVEKNPEAALEAMGRHTDYIDRYSRHLWVAPDDPPTLDKLGDWVQERCEDGCEVIVVDPVTAAAASDRPWIDDLRFLMRAKSIVRRHKARLILVTHPRKQTGKSTFGKSTDELAGGAAYGRFAQCVLWLEYMEKSESARCQKGDEVRTWHINRKGQIRKSRNGRGQGTEVGYFFDPTSLKFQEAGIILDDEDEDDPSSAPV